jgi:hypothetical protein
MERDGWDHTEKGLWVKGIMMIRATRGIQWGKAQIRGSKGFGSMGKKNC